MKEFDTQKGAFYLVAFVIATQMIIALVVTGGCVFGALDRILPSGACKGVMEQMMELFQMCFTAAIAFAGGRYSAPQPPEIKLPEKEEPK